MNGRAPRIALKEEVSGMAFFQDLGKTLSEAAQTVGRRTSEAAEISRLNAKLAGIRSQVDELYAQIGKAYYATREAQGAHEAASRLCDEIDRLNDQADTVARLIDRIKHQSRCPNCGEIQPAQSRFCASCGSRMPEDEPLIEPAEETVKVEADDSAETALSAGPAQSASASEAAETQAFDKGDVNVEINWPKAKEEPITGDRAESTTDGVGDQEEPT